MPPIDPAMLPTDIELLHKMILELAAENQSLQHRLEQILRSHFGPKSERLSESGLQDLFEFLRSQAQTPPGENPAEPPVSQPDPVEKKKRPNGHGRKPLPKDLPRVRIEHTLPEQERVCPCCGGIQQPFGETITEQLDYLPARFLVREHVRIKYACQKCRQGVSTPQLPPFPIDKGLPAAGLLAHVAVSKFADHLPLYRLEQIFKRSGVQLSRQTLCGWIRACSNLLEPVYDELRRDVLQSYVIHSDDTILPVLDDSRKHARQGRVWVYAGDFQHPHVVYDYTQDRSSRRPIDFLNGYQGFLQADAYSGYDRLFTQNPITEVGCWAHTRRYFFEAKPSDALRGSYALAVIAQLYQAEEKARDLDPEARQELREKESLPILLQFHEWLETQATQVLPKSPIHQAIQYALNQWQALLRYVHDGRLAIDNNAAERELRRVAIGRKNFLFTGSDAGGERAAILYSLIASCQRNSIDPLAYLTDLLQRVLVYPARKVNDLIPANWKKLFADPAPT
jgi:transposase